MEDCNMKNYIMGTNGLIFVKDRMPNCWINIEEPTSAEIQYLTQELKIPLSFLKDIEDVDERPRIENEDDWQIIIIRIPVRSNDEKLPFITVPLGIILKGDIIHRLLLQIRDVI